MGRNRGPAAVELTLSGDERGQLIRWARRRKSAQALRCRIVLECSTGASNAEVARGGMSVPTVRKWRDRFVEHRLDGLVDIPRPPVIGMEQVERVIMTPWSPRPRGPRTGCGPGWPAPRDCRPSRSAGSGGPSVSSRTVVRGSGCPMTPAASINPTHPGVGVRGVSRTGSFSFPESVGWRPCQQRNTLRSC